MKEECNYGCTTQNLDEVCSNCKHPKKNHSAVHPHACKGELDIQGVHYIKICTCSQFTLKKEKSNEG